MTSFLIACYNKENYIQRCVESCLNQSEYELEVCVVDDGSTDRSWEILVSEYQKHPKVKLFRFPKNQGKVAAYNKAYEIAEGNFFALVGADDFNHPDRLKSSLTRMIENNENFCYGNLIQIDLITGKKSNFKGINKIRRNNYLRTNIISGGSLLFDDNVGDKAFPIPIFFRYEDWYIAIIAIKFYRGSWIDTTVGYYQITGENENIQSSSLSIAEKLNNRKKVISRDFEIIEFFLNRLRKNFNAQEIKELEIGRGFRQILLEDDFIKRLNLLLKYPKLFFEPRNLFISILGSKFIIKLKHLYQNYFI